MSTIDVKIPALGDYKDVPVIDVLVKPGDAVSANDALVTLESDKATMDVPAPASGTVRELKLKVGDRVGEGSLVAVMEATDGAARAAPPAPAPSTPASAPSLTPSIGSVESGPTSTA